ncbi:MAG: PD-(D/E)XK nuclease family protein [Muribaculaceae bacterium]|nr:PD-(D/E)XK nuclease family protein [Muribaculaceae bacterium]
MNPFLYSVAQEFYNREGDGVKDNTFIFPSRRAELFFIKYLSQISKKPIFSPNTITVDDFISQISGYAPADRVEMLFVLYDNYIKLSKSEETFDDFYYWADILLTDFDDVDKYLVDASKIFSNLYQLKEIDAQFKDMLTDEQKVFLKRFIANFNYDENIDGSKKEFVSLWKTMYELYQGLKDDLEKKGCAYNGMMLRSIIESISAGKITKEDIKLRYKKVVFVGFNLLSTAEEKLMTQLKDMGVADFYWDYNLPMQNDIYSISAVSMAQNKERYPSKYQLNEQKADKLPDIELVAIPSNIGQTKYAGEIINNIQKQNGALDIVNTVVVLPDEKLLMPMLHSIPTSVESVNVTMGYPLSETPLFSLFRAIFDMLNRTKQDDDGNVKYYHQNVLSLLSQPYIRAIHKDAVEKFTNEIKSNNLVYIVDANIPEELKYLFASLSDKGEVFGYIKTIIGNIIRKIDKSDAITREFLYYYQTIINRLQNITKEFPIKTKTLFKLIEKMSAGVKVPFNGEPLSGLQIMGVLETRALDFDNVIILSMNEGVFPADSRGDTFIPYNVRKGFGMSSYEQRDGIAEYYFYRLISRAKKVYLTYDTRTEGVKIGDVSRFVYQLKYQYGGNISSFNERNINYSIKLPEETVVKVEKKGEVLNLLKEYDKGGCKKLSASSINVYLDCPLKFYFSSVENIEEPDKVLEDVDASVFGLIFHEIMQKIYTPYEGKIITPEIIDDIVANEKNIEDVMLKAFAKNYYNVKTPKPLTGRLYLRGEVIKKMVNKTLELDKQRAPFKMIKTEFKVETTTVLSNGREVQLKGSIDRVDFSDNNINIIDYKSGKVYLEFDTVENVFYAQKDRKKQVFQLLFYVLLMKNIIVDNATGKNKDEKVTTVLKNAGVNGSSNNQNYLPGLYAFDNYFSNEFEWQIRTKINDAIDLVTITPDSEIYKKYELVLEECISSIFNTDIPFTQTENRDVCKYCSFTNICRR